MSTATATATQTYTIDKSHSEVAFQVRHLLTKVRGRFSDFDGTVTYDEQDPERATVDATVQATSIDTNEADRDKHLRSADFFDVAKFPTLTFNTLSVRKEGQGLALEGVLTIHGITRPVTFAVTYLGRAKDPWGNQRLGFEAETTINRKHYGLMWNAALETGGFLVGDDVKILLSVQAVAQK